MALQAFKDEKLSFNVNDFESINIDIRFRNLTSGLNETARSPQLQLLETRPQGLVISVPSKRCAFGHQVEIDIVGESHKRKVTFHGTAKVVIHDREDGETDRVGVDFMQLDHQTWSNFLSIFQERQKEIEDFFNGVKGY